MRFKILALAFACLSVAASARARSFEHGPRLAISVPTGSASVSTDPGINAGWTATFMGDGVTGFSMDLMYHRWPGSTDANAAFDDLLSSFSGTPITGSKVTLSAFQATGHLKLVPKTSGQVAPWVRLGAGVYRLNSHVDLPWDQLQAAGVQGETGGWDNIHYTFGYVGTLGLDFKTGANMKPGLDASYHYLDWQDASGAHFTAFTVGVHFFW